MQKRLRDMLLNIQEEPHSQKSQAMDAVESILLKENQKNNQQRSMFVCLHYLWAWMKKERM